MALVNHLINRESARAVQAVAAGRHVVDGHLVWSKTLGVEPSHQLVLRQALGRGVWQGPEGIWYKGLNVPAADYLFFDGSQTGATSTLFPTDKNAHTGTVLLDVKAPVGVGSADTAATTPDLAFGIFKTEKFPDFNAGGDQIDPANPSTVVVTNAALIAGTPLDEDYFTYTASPARVMVGWLFKYGRIRHDRINWAKWDAWRDYCDGLESVDYTTIPDFDGIGLSADYYSGTLFNTLLWQRIDPAISFANTVGTPAVGLPLDSFSVRWEGKIKAKYTETYTFKIVHDNGARLWVNGVAMFDHGVTWNDTGDITPGTHTGTIALTAGSFYDIKVEWNEGVANAEFILSWSSASQPEQVIPPEVLYPKVRNLPRYEAHVAFSTPTTLDQMMAAVLRVSNSIKQEVDGKMEFYCLEQLAPSFAFDDADNPKTILEQGGVSQFFPAPADVRATEQQNVFEATFRDLDSQYLEEPLKPIVERAGDLIAEAGREIYGDVIELGGNMTRWQARKVLKRIVGEIALNNQTASLEGSALAYKVIAGDLVTVTHSAFGYDAKKYLVIDATDASPEEKADTRSFLLREWDAAEVSSGGTGDTLTDEEGFILTDEEDYELIEG
jgi:hypothetical protein